MGYNPPTMTVSSVPFTTIDVDATFTLEVGTEVVIFVDWLNISTMLDAVYAEAVLLFSIPQVASATVEEGPPFVPKH